MKELELREPKACAVLPTKSYAGALLFFALSDARPLEGIVIFIDELKDKITEP
jgi:hypothetical protein